MRSFIHRVRRFIVLCFPVLVALGCVRHTEDRMVRQEIQAISEMKQLGLVEYRVRKIVKADDTGEWYKIGDRKILLSCTAYLKAGIDLSSFGEDNVIVEHSENTVSVTLPHATLLSLDMPASEIRLEYDQVTLLRSPFTAEERNALLRQGERQIRESVPSLGILQKAEENALRFFESVFSKMGFQEVNVIFKD